MCCVHTRDIGKVSCVVKIEVLCHRMNWHACKSYWIWKRPMPEGGRVGNNASQNIWRAHTFEIRLTLYIPKEKKLGSISRSYQDTNFWWKEPPQERMQCLKNRFTWWECGKGHLHVVLGRWHYNSIIPKTVYEPECPIAPAPLLCYPAHLPDTVCLPWASAFYNLTEVTKLANFYVIVAYYAPF